MALSLEQRLDFEADGWDPQPGDKVVGEVVAVTEYESTKRQGETYPVVDVLTDPDTITGLRIYGSRTVLGNELRKLDPKPGDRLAVKFLGLQKPGTDGEYFGYKVMLERAAVASPRLTVVPSAAVPADPDGDSLDEERRMEARHLDVVDVGPSWPDSPLPDDD
jgi:hypothetical protein